MKPVDVARKLLLEPCQYSMQYYRGWACTLIMDCQCDEQCTTYDEMDCPAKKQSKFVKD